jgi:hypothetical protein
MSHDQKYILKINILAINCGICNDLMQRRFSNCLDGFAKQKKKVFKINNLERLTAWTASLAI